jgi:hypothetical protein
MPVEVHVLFNGKLPSKDQLARTLKELEFPLTFAAGTGALATHAGFLPMRWKSDDTGFEFDLVSGPEDLADLRYDGVDPRLDRCAVFRVGGDMTELFAAQATAVAFAKLTAGVVCDPQEDRALTIDEAIAFARSTLAIVAPPGRPPGTRIPDIPRHLKPLLTLRRDLMLRKRQLFIRPVRHFLRGAWLGKEFPYQFGVHLFFDRLYLPPTQSYSGYHNEQRVDVWPPHFEPWLFDVLHHDVFKIAKQITGIADIPDFQRKNAGHLEPCVLDYLLAGERDRAEDLVRQFEYKKASFAGKARALLERNIEDICAECHEREAERAKELNLGAAWQQSPFPVELPAAIRRQQTDESTFDLAPWIETEEPITMGPPEVPGELAYARHWTARDGKHVLVAPLTRDQAQALHDEGDPYVLFARLPADELLSLHYTGNRDIDDPFKERKYRRDEYFLRLDTPSRRLLARFWERNSDPGMLNIFTIEIVWLNGSNRCGVEVFSEQWRPPYAWESGRGNQPLTDRERALIRMPLPQFGDYDALLARTNQLLEHAGCESFTALSR